MKGKLGKTGLLSLALVLALAVLGVAFAYWTENLHIQSDVKTGELDVKFVGAQSSDPMDTNDATLGGNWTGFTIVPQGKHVGKTEVTHGDKITTITISNGYPGYLVWTQLDIKNTGSIPVTLTGFEFVPPEVGGIPTAYWLSYKGLTTVAWAITKEDGGVVIASGSSFPITNPPVPIPSPGYPASYATLFHDILAVMVYELMQVTLAPEDTLEVHLLFHLTAEGVSYPEYGDIPAAGNTAENLPGSPGDISFSVTATFTQWNAP